MGAAAGTVNPAEIHKSRPKKALRPNPVSRVVRKNGKAIVCRQFLVRNNSGSMLAIPIRDRSTRDPRSPQFQPS